MNKATVWIIVIMLLMAGLFAYIWFSYKPKVENNNYNISLIAEYGGKKMPTQFRVNYSKYINTSIFYETFEYPNGTLILENLNIDDQLFYEDIREYLIEENTRIDYELDKVVIPEIEITKGNPINLTISSECFKNVKFCIKSSVNYLFLKSNYTEIQKLENYENYDKCYDLGMSLEESSAVIPISYTQMSEPTKYDYINITVIDKQGNFVSKRIL